MILILDNFDSFTFLLKDYFEQLGKTCLVVKNDILVSSINLDQVEAMVISPGPQKPSDANNLMAIIEFCHDKVPILGICLGHQALAEFFGGNLRKMAHPVHGQQWEIYHEQSALFANCASPLKVARYHSWLVCDLPHELQTTAETKDGHCMAFQHHELPVFGIQFHPESILTPTGLKVFQNWLTAVSKSNNISS